MKRLIARPLLVGETRDLAIGVDLRESFAELLAFANVDCVGVVLGEAKLAQLFKEDCNLVPVRGAETVQLKRSRSNGDLCFVAGASGWTVDRSKLVACRGGEKVLYDWSWSPGSAGRRRLGGHCAGGIERGEEDL